MDLNASHLNASNLLNLDSFKLTNARKSQIDLPKTPRSFNDHLRSYVPSQMDKSPKAPTLRLDVKDNIKIDVRSPKSNIPVPDYMIMYPYSSKETPRSARVHKTFVSFNSILTNKLNTSASQREESFFAPFTSREELNKQLAFNKKQEQMFRGAAKKESEDSYYGVQNLISNLKKKKLPKITVYPSYRSFNLSLDNSKQGDENSEADEEKKPDDSAGIKTWVKLDNASCRWYWQTAPVDSNWNPNAREGSAFISAGKFGYLYGGVSKDLHNQIEILDISKWQWSSPKQTGDIPEQGRQGHSLDYYEKTLVVFGGAMCFNTNLRLRECLSEVRFFNIEKSEWRYVKCSGEYIAGRRNHASVIVGKHLLVYGGIDASGDYLDDIKVLDLVRFDWKKEEPENHPLEGIAFHRACVVIAPQKTKISLHKIVDSKPDKSGNAKIQEEGIYFFGGRTHDDEISSTLRILKIGQRTLSWVVPKTQGVSPGPRFQHTMVFCPMLNVVVVYGGRNDYLFSKGKSPLVEEVFALDLEKLTWLNIPTLGQRPSPRSSHVAGVFGTKMLVFGGINMNRYCDFEANLLEMDPVAAKKQILEKELERAKTYGIYPLVTKKSKAPVEESFRTNESELHKKEYTGLTTFLPVMSKKQLAKRRQEVPDLDGELKNLLAGMNLSDTQRKSLLLTNRSRGSVFKNLK